MSPGAVDDLSLSLVEANLKRLLRADLSNLARGSPVVLLCDFVMPVYPLARYCAELQGRGATKILIAGVARYADAQLIRDVRIISFVETSYRTATPGNGCNFCKQGVPIVQGLDYESFARNIRDFDDFTFW